MTQIDPQTVVNSRPNIIKLAQDVFGRSGGNAVRAFSQFRLNTDLAALIEAKYQGIFDYGACIVDTDSGCKWPQPEKAMDALKKAMDGTISASDMTVLGLTEADFSKVVPAAPAKAQKASVKKPEEPRQTQPAPVAAAPVEPQAPAAWPRPAQAVASGNVVEAINNRFSDLGEGLEAAFRKISEANAAQVARISQMQSEIDALKAGIFGLIGMVSTVNKNVALMAEYFVDPGFQPAAFPEGLDAYLQRVAHHVPHEPQAQAVSATQAPEVDGAPVEAPKEEAPVQKAAVQAPASETVSYTDEELAAMEIDDLKKLAASLGVPNADKIAYKGVVIRRIKERASA